MNGSQSDARRILSGGFNHVNIGTSRDAALSGCMNIRVALHSPLEAAATWVSPMAGCAWEATSSLTALLKPSSRALRAAHFMHADHLSDH